MVVVRVLEKKDPPTNILGSFCIMKVKERFRIYLDEEFLQTQEKIKINGAHEMNEKETKNFLSRKMLDQSAICKAQEIMRHSWEGCFSTIAF